MTLPKRLALAAFALCSSLLLPRDTLAHSPIPGIEGFYIGILHPLSTPSQLLALLAMGVMLGLRWPKWFPVSWVTFAAAMLLGIGLGQFGLMPGGEEPMLLLVAILAAMLSALYPTGFLTTFVILLGVCGMLIGVLSIPDKGSVRATIITLLGSFVGANLALIYVAGGVGWLRERFAQQWLRIGLRIIAAWMAAIGILMLGMAWRSFSTI